MNNQNRIKLECPRCRRVFPGAPDTVFIQMSYEKSEKGLVLELTPIFQCPGRDCSFKGSLFGGPIPEADGSTP